MIIKSAEFLKSSTNPKDYPEENLPEIAFAGKSNVGKSSLLNTILGRKKLAKTSSTPGRTQLINYFLVNGEFFFVDLPGYGYAKVSKKMRKGWGQMMEMYFRESANLRCVILILDIRRLMSDDDVNLVNFLYSLNIPVVYVLTKSDKVSNNEIFKQKAKLKKSLGDFYHEDIFVIFSSHTKRGKDEVLNKIKFYLED